MITRHCPHCNHPLTVVSSDEGTHFYQCRAHGVVAPKPLLVGKHPAPVEGRIVAHLDDEPLWERFEHDVPGLPRWREIPSADDEPTS